jgi:arylsulfatase A-like enzyme
MSTKNKPNIILIIIDSARADYFSCLGYRHPTTPHIDSLASKSLIFKNAFSNAGWTYPAIASILTGIHPLCFRSYSRLDPEIDTIADCLSQYGYKTAGVTWCPFISPHTGLNKGFDRYIFFNARNVFKRIDPSALFRFMLKFKPAHLKHRFKHSLGNILINEQAKNFVIKYKCNEPFFLFLHFSVHHPYQAPPPYLNKFMDRKISKYVQANIGKFINIASKRTCDKSITDYDIDILIRLYEGMLAYVDYVIGDFVNFLKRQGVFENTLFIITADHGDFFGEHGLLFHTFDLYDEVIKVPLIIKLPGDSKKKIVESLVQTSDIFPTLVDYLNIRLTSVRQKLIQFSLFADNPGHEFIVSERRDVTMDGIQRAIINDLVGKEQYLEDILSIRTDKYKLIWSSKQRHRLYDLKKDPKENNNIYSLNNHIVNSLLSMLNEWKESLENYNSNQAIEFDEKTKTHLEDLGYIV